MDSSSVRIIDCKTKTLPTKLNFPPEVSIDYGASPSSPFVYKIIKIKQDISWIENFSFKSFHWRVLISSSYVSQNMSKHYVLLRCPAIKSFKKWWEYLCTPGTPEKRNWTINYSEVGPDFLRGAELPKFSSFFLKCSTLKITFQVSTSYTKEPFNPFINTNIGLELYFPREQWRKA